MTRNIKMFAIILIVILAFSMSLTANAGTLPVVISSTHPDQDQWYRSNTPSFSWTPSGMMGYSYVFDSVATTVPDQISEGRGTLWPAPSQADGIYYFHVRGQVSADSWTETTHFRVKIDKTAPVVNSCVIDNAAGTCYSLYAGISLDAADSSSGIDRVEISNSESFAPKEVRAYSFYIPWKLKSNIDTSTGKEVSETKHAYIYVFDAAGNMSVKIDRSINYSNPCPT